MDSKELASIVDERLEKLDLRVTKVEIAQTRVEKDVLGISLDLKYLRQSQDALNSNLSKFLWIVGGGFIAAIVSFVIKGGLIL